MANSKVLVPWDTGVKARALRAVMIFSLATAPDFNSNTYTCISGDIVACGRGGGCMRILGTRTHESTYPVCHGNHQYLF